MKCVLPECPVAFGECDRDSECYIWRCEHPHAPPASPGGERFKSVRPSLLAALLLAVFLFTGSFDYADALNMQAEETEARVQRVIAAHIVGIDAPRCDKVTSDYRALRYSIAHRGDRILSWFLLCHYESQGGTP